MRLRQPVHRDKTHTHAWSCMPAKTNGILIVQYCCTWCHFTSFQKFLPDDETCYAIFFAVSPLSIPLSLSVLMFWRKRTKLPSLLLCVILLKKRWVLQRHFALTAFNMWEWNSLHSSSFLPATWVTNWKHVTSASDFVSISILTRT